ncbi:MAG: LytR C-terminal domain-containing protein [Calditrichaeota bacterium]|nr:LytR C-terminal domain-containing protein [Calditrichota bacterium]
MVKRTRRNLSDPAVRRVLKSQFKQGSESEAEPRSRWSRFFRVVGLSALVLLVLFNTLVVLKTTNWQTFEWIDLPDNAFSSGTESTTNKTPKRPKASPSSINQTPAGSQTPAQSVSTPVSEPTPPVPKPKPIARKIQVEVLNGCGVEGIASRMTDYLRSQGIDVVDNRNYKHFNVKESFILNRSGNEERAKKVARLIGLPLKQVRLEKNDNLQLDLTIVLGSDYKKFKPFKK